MCSLHTSLTATLEFTVHPCTHSSCLNVWDHLVFSCKWMMKVYSTVQFLNLFHLSLSPTPYSKVTLNTILTTVNIYYYSICPFAISQLCALPLLWKCRTPQQRWFIFQTVMWPRSALASPFWNAYLFELLFKLLLINVFEYSYLFLFSPAFVFAFC